MKILLSKMFFEGYLRKYFILTNYFEVIFFFLL